MNPKQEIINKFEKHIKEELENLDNILNKENKNIALDTLYKIHLYLKHFDELETVLNKAIDEISEKEKWER